MTNFLGKILGKSAIDKEQELARRLEASGAKNVEVVGRGAIVTSKEDLATSETVRLMRITARKIVSENTSNDKDADKEG